MYTSHVHFKYSIYDEKPFSLVEKKFSKILSAAKKSMYSWVGKFALRGI